VGQQNPNDPSSWNNPVGQPGQFGPGQPGQFGTNQPGQYGQPGQFGVGPPPPPPSGGGIGFLPKALAVLGGLIAAGILLLAIGGNLGHNATNGLNSLVPTPAIHTYSLKVTISGRNLNETIYFKIVSTETEKTAFVDGFQKGIDKTPNLTATINDLSVLPTDAQFVCNIKLPSSATLRSVDAYSVAGDKLSRDIAQAGCDAANASG
jgi:hypothetical protein